MGQWKITAKKTTGAALAFLLLLAGTGYSWQRHAPQPNVGGTSQDADMAANHPDEYAWELFMALNWDAVQDKAGVADLSKPFPRWDPGDAVVWETWALA